MTYRANIWTKNKQRLSDLHLGFSQPGGSVLFSVVPYRA
jgi:hypothetical protein